ncbi:MAG: DUF2125 domain-containing protein [Acetobacteraceae bacterium]|nr:DUF2125 domain-containing protein [Acetobacteraceae bacterium]
MNRPIGSEAARSKAGIRWLGIGLLVGLIGLAIAHTLYWRAVEQQLERGLEEWVAARRAEGWQVRIGRTERRGWPLAARLLVTDVGLEGGPDDLPGGLAWNADRLELSVRLLDPRQLSIEPEGTQRLRLSVLPAVAYTADRIRADIPLDPGGKVHHVTVRADNIRAGIAENSAAVRTGLQATSGLGTPLTVGLLQAAIDLYPDRARTSEALAAPVAGLTLSAEAIGLPSGLGRALGGHISSLSFDGTLSGPLPSTDPQFARELGARMPGVTRRASAWRDGGGSVAVQRVSLGWGPLGLTARGSLGLDAHLQPTATGSARVVGYAETLDRLATSGLISPGAATAVKALAGLIARTPEGGGPAEIEVPLSLQDRMLSIRQIPLARIPELTWPAG